MILCALFNFLLCRLSIDKGFMGKNAKGLRMCLTAGSFFERKTLKPQDF